MDVKYIVIDLSKVDGDKLGEMLSKAYEDGYKDGINSVITINAPTIPYNGDEWSNITGYSTTTTNSMAIDTSLTSNGDIIRADSKPHTITLTNDVTTAIKNTN